MYDDIKNAFKYLGSLGQIGLLVVICALIGMALGYLIDKWLRTGDIFKIGLMIFGCGAGMYSAYKMIMGMIEKEDAGKKN